MQIDKYVNSLFVITVIWVYLQFIVGIFRPPKACFVVAHPATGIVLEFLKSEKGQKIGFELGSFCIISIFDCLFSIELRAAG